MGYLNPYLIKLIEEAIKDEGRDFALYTQIAEVCGENAEEMKAIAADELKHKKMLEELYEDLTGKNPPQESYRGETTRGKGCAELIAERIKEELEGAKMYRTMYFAMPEQRGKNLLFEIMTDEIFHALTLGAMK